MDSSLKIGDERCLTAASKAVVPSFWFLETGMPDQGFMKLSCLPWEEGTDSPNQGITCSAFLPSDQQGMQNTDSETLTEISPHAQLLPQRTGTANRHQCSNLIKTAHQG